MQMSVPAPDFRGLSDEEIWDRLHAGDVNSPAHIQARLTLELRNLERQTRASQQLVTATGHMATFTKRLVFGTWGLVLATAALFVTTLFHLLLTLRSAN